MNTYESSKGIAWQKLKVPQWLFISRETGVISTSGQNSVMLPWHLLLDRQ